MVVFLFCGVIKVLKITWICLHQSLCKVFTRLKYQKVEGIIAELKSEASNRGARVAMSLYVRMFVSMYVCISVAVSS